jgi:hypothetical protein
MITIKVVKYCIGKNFNLDNSYCAIITILLQNGYFFYLICISHVQAMPGFGGLQETKYSAQHAFQGGQAGSLPPPSHTPPVSAAAAAAYHGSAGAAAAGGFGDVLNRYKLEQTIRQLHGIHSTDPRASFGANFSGV